MFRLLIVDDEAIIADGLYEVFQNQTHLELDVYKAYSGTEALALLDRTRMDIVLSDIRMPGMDGLEMMKEIRLRWPKCRIIFLTGFNEFDYVYTAIQYENVNYLLKTEGYPKVIETVEQTVAEIEKNLKFDQIVQKASEQLDAMKYLLQTDYLNSFILGELSREEINPAQFSELGIPLDASEPAVLLLGHMDDFPKNVSYSDKSRLLYGIKLIVEQYLPEQIPFIHFATEHAYLLWIIQVRRQGSSGDEPEVLRNGPGDTLNYIKESLDLIQAACQESVGILLSFALDNAPRPWKDLPESFVALKMLLSNPIGQGAGMLLTDKKDIAGTSAAQGKSGLNRNLLDQLAESLDYGKRDSFMEGLNLVTKELEQAGSLHDMSAWEIYHAVALIFVSYIKRWNLTEKIAFEIGLYKLLRYDGHESWPQAVDYLRQLAAILFDLQNTDKEQRAQDVIEIIRKHVTDNIHNPDEVSLIRLADLLYFNPSYLSRLFKQIAGTNLSDFISDVRIKKAKLLLERPEMRISDVAEAVGYGTTTNFTRFFRKVTHMTPQEYRDHLAAK